MKHFRTLLVAGALAVSMLGIAAIASAQDAAPETAVTPQPYLGVVFEGTDGGITVVEVIPDSPAAAAGIVADDVITAINGTAVTEDNIRETLQGLAVGDVASVAVTRGEEQLTLDVTLAAAPEQIRPPRPSMELFRSNRPLLGVGIEDSDNGVVVTAVNPGSPAETAGLAVDDVITAINGTAIATAQEAAQAIGAAADAAEVGEFTVAVSVTRGDAALNLSATLVKSDKLEMPNIPDLGGRGGRGERGFGMPGLQIVPREGEDGKFDIVVPFTPADPAAVTQDVIDALATIGITITPREGEDGVFDLSIPAESLSNGNLLFPDLQGMMPQLRDMVPGGFGTFDFAIPNIPGQPNPANPNVPGGSL